jgi:hypothetical protein
MNSFFDSADDPLLQAILLDLRKRREQVLTPQTDILSPPEEFTPFSRPEPRTSPILPRAGAPELPGPPEPPAPFEPPGDPFDEPPGDLAPPLPAPPRFPQAPPIPQPTLGGAPDRLEPQLPSSSRSTPVLPRALGGALAQALLRASRPAPLGVARSRNRGRSRNAGLRSRAIDF